MMHYLYLFPSIFSSFAKTKIESLREKEERRRSKGAKEEKLKEGKVSDFDHFSAESTHLRHQRLVIEVGSR